jgi:hypothetical protein
LPATYFAWLDTLPGPCYVKFKRREWDVATRDRLEESLQINREVVPYHAQLTAYAESWRRRGFDAAEGPKKSRFPYDRLDRCVTIGTDHGDPLFVDPGDNFSVWRLRLASQCGTVAAVTPSLDEWINNAKPVIEEMDDF